VKTWQLLYDAPEIFKKLGRTIRQWFEPIIRMWCFSKNNGITEGFHRKMKLDTAVGLWLSQFSDSHFFAPCRARQRREHPLGFPAHKSRISNSLTARQQNPATVKVPAAKVGNRREKFSHSFPTFSRFSPPAVTLACSSFFPLHFLHVPANMPPNMNSDMNSDASPSSSAKKSAKPDTLALLLMLACCAVPAYICIDFRFFAEQCRDDMNRACEKQSALNTEMQSITGEEK